MEAPGEDLSPALALGQEANAPSLGGWRDVAAIATHAPARPARIEALIKLAERRDPAALEPLLKAATDADWVTRKYAMSGLGILGRPTPVAFTEGREPLADGGPAPVGGREPLAEPRTAAALVVGLRDPHVEVRRAAARALRAPRSSCPRAGSTTPTGSAARSPRTPSPAAEPRVDPETRIRPGCGPYVLLDRSRTARGVGWLVSVSNSKGSALWPKVATSGTPMPARRFCAGPVFPFSPHPSRSP